MSIPRIDEKPYGFGFPTYFSRDGGMIHNCSRLIFFTRGLCHKAKPCHIEVALKNYAADTGQEFFDWLYAQLSSDTVKLPEKMQGKFWRSTQGGGIIIEFYLDEEQSHNCPTAVEAVRCCLVGLQQWVAHLIPDFTRTQKLTR